VLVVVPHPDDEVIATGGTIHALAAAGARVGVVMLTAGDGYLRAARRLVGRTPDARAYRALGEKRRAESLVAAGTLGVPTDGVVCLGYQDGGLAALLEADPVAPHGRNGGNEVPYPWAPSPGAPYTGHALVADLARIAEGFDPTAVIAPDPRDANPDHRATAALTERALGEAAYSGRRFGVLVHRGHYPFPWLYRPGAELRPPRALAGRGVWHTLRLSSADEKAKERAIEDYRSQTAVWDLHWFMRAFVRRTELFSEPDRAATARRADPTPAYPKRPVM
jgi:N-acetyl-1-D-myo-inositol-2-amino-2-deoxy-alpha-D-glucopyranoside deacetylase